MFLSQLVGFIRKLRRFSLTRALQGIFPGRPNVFLVDVNHLFLWQSFFEFSRADWLLLIVTCNAILSGAEMILLICCALRFLKLLWQNLSNSGNIHWGHNRYSVNFDFELTEHLRNQLRSKNKRLFVIVWQLEFLNGENQTMSYRKHGFWVLIEHCFKQTEMKYVDYSIKLSPYSQFCCPLSLTSTLPSANIPVSPQFFSEFDILTFTARHFEKPLILSSTRPTRKPPKAAL